MSKKNNQNNKTITALDALDKSYRKKIINYFLSRQFAQSRTIEDNDDENENLENNSTENTTYTTSDDNTTYTTSDDNTNDSQTEYSDDSQSETSTEIKKPKMKLKKSIYKWDTLEHNGLKFPEEYVYKHIPILYNGKEIYLSKEAEEVAFLYAKYANSEYAENSTFNKNFFNDWKKILGKTSEIQNFDLCDFTLMSNYLFEEKEKQKELKKTQEKPTVDPDEIFKTAIVDGKKQTISIYKVEPPGIFIGRGKNPHLGKVKKRINPEDITINIGKDAVVPDPPTGHKWGKIIHDRKVEWLASWKDTITGKTKYFWLSQQSDMKAENDQRKYDVARKLKKKIKFIHDENDNNMRSLDDKIMQIATALYFIDKLAIRVGNEKGDGETDTVGVTSLRVEHVTLTEPNEITLDFLGKDSVPYTNTVEVEPIVFSNVKKLLKNKEKGDQVFEKINSNDVNKYLQEFMKELTAKVFRTYNASNLFQKELAKITKKYEGQTGVEKQIMDDFAKANAKVAKLLNHQKNVSSGYKKGVDKITEQINSLKKKLNSARRKTKKNPTTIQKLKERINNFKSKKELLKEMKNISLGTSKANYVDPRITVAFLKKHNLNIDKIFPKTLQNKFVWAFEVDSDYKF